MINFVTMQQPAGIFWILYCTCMLIGVFGSFGMQAISIQPIVHCSVFRVYSNQGSRGLTILLQCTCAKMHVLHV